MLFFDVQGILKSCMNAYTGADDAMKLTITNPFLSPMSAPDELLRGYVYHQNTIKNSSISTMI